MGCDGGSIPKRDEMVQLKKPEERANPAELERGRWFSCAISKQKIKPPVVCDYLGNIFNKDVVIRCLLDKKMPTNFSHIKTMKDIITLNFTPNKEYKQYGEKDSSGVKDLAQDSPFCCPVSGLFVGSGHKFCTIISCGCVFSERALRECPSDNCLTCTKPFNNDDLLILNPDDEELKVQKLKLKERQEKLLLEKKKKKNNSKTAQNKRKAEDNDSSESTNDLENKKQKSEITTKS